MSVNSVNFGTSQAARPYGYDPEKGRYTPEQAKKDFKPGIYNPKQQEEVAKRTNNILKAILTLGVVAAGALFLFKTNKGKELLKKGKEFFGELFNKKIELRTKIPAAEAAQNRQYALDFAKKPIRTFKLASMSKNGGEVNVNLPTMINRAERAKYADFWKNVDLDKVTKRADLFKK